MRRTRQSAYTDQELIDDAKQFHTRQEWEAAGEKEVEQGQPSHHRVAIKRGIEFYRQCCAHMPDLRGTHATQKYSDDDLLASARQFQTRGEWKNSSNRQHYKMALRRPIWDECVAHMRPAANPFAKDYIVYAYEFSDGYAYVGLTFVEANRRIMHSIRGPVFDHAKICPNPVYKVLESGMPYQEVGPAEDKWQAEYISKGWTPLWTAKPGSLGGMHRKWTKEAVFAKAKEFQTRKEWYLGSQFTYSLAKREGWFEQAAAHMPRRVLGIGAGVPKSEEAKEKMRQAKLGKTQSAEQKAAKSAAITQWWANRRAKPVPPTTSAVDTDLAESVVNSLL